MARLMVIGQKSSRQCTRFPTFHVIRNMYVFRIWSLKNGHISKTGLRIEVFVIFIVISIQSKDSSLQIDRIIINTSLQILAYKYRILN